MQVCIPKKGDFITLTENIISSVGSQKLEFYSKKYPEFHSRQTSFILKKGEWYQIGSIYVLKSNIYFNLRLQRSKSTRTWIKKRIEEEFEKVSLAYSDEDDQPILKSRSLECFGDDLNKNCIVSHHMYGAIQTRELIMRTLVNKGISRWEQLR